MSLFRIFVRQLAEIESMSVSKKVITRDEWEKKLKQVKIRKEDMNKVVMNFLVTEGFVDAAQRFQMESGTQPDTDLATITDRMAVKNAVQCGNVEDAIEKVNDLNPETTMGLWSETPAARNKELSRGIRVHVTPLIISKHSVNLSVDSSFVSVLVNRSVLVTSVRQIRKILDTNPQLFFHLQQQRLIELIRNGKVEEALEFAQEELAPRGEENVYLILLSFK
ncbi:hypothetical protein GIB67_031191 [Kingdonia uniflora]|uniref:CTLH domain-containing protein n=1 Tax=Kingdonia uniflora TaxID=39325 RepID=A0A7J7NL06_9MAGN|nr:hypothetical protein GIB67_031191 [Kingdonia uniflora]